MTPGKIAAQAGHAFLGAFLLSSTDISKKYHAEFPSSPGTKICLNCPSLSELIHIEQLAVKYNITTYKVIDSGCSNFYNGQPIITALGIGPATKNQLQNLISHLKLI